MTRLLLAIDPGMHSGYAFGRMTEKKSFHVLKRGTLSVPRSLKDRNARLEWMRGEIKNLIREIKNAAWPNTNPPPDPSKCPEVNAIIEKQYIAMQRTKKSSKFLGNPYDIMAVAEITGMWAMACEFLISQISGNGKLIRVAPVTWQAFYGRGKGAKKSWSVDEVNRWSETDLLDIGGDKLPKSEHNEADAILIGAYGTCQIIGGYDAKTKP